MAENIGLSLPISLPEQAQTGHELSVMCTQTNVASGQADATNEHAMVFRLPKPRVQPVGLAVQGPTMRLGRVVRRPSYLKDYVT